jgi:hypothetical protein
LPSERPGIHSDLGPVVTAAVVYVIIGGLLVVMALSTSVLKRLPPTTSLRHWTDA